MKVLKVSLSFCFFVFVFLVFVAGASAETNEDAFVYDKLTIVSDKVVLTGQTQQMMVEEYTGMGTGPFIWSSSNPTVISCTTDGQITGIKEGKATITVKALFSSGYDSITVYCVQKLANPQTARPVNAVYFTFRAPHLFGFSGFKFNINPFQMFFSNFSGFYTGPKYYIKGTYGSYFYVEYENNDKQYECFIPQTSFSDNIASEEIFKQLSHTDMNVFVGVDKDSYVLTTNYKGEVKWTESDESIIDIDDKTGKVTGLKPGIATISATANGKTLTCTVHSIYVWPQDWTGAARQTTCVYKSKGSTYEKTSTELAVGDTFTVKGDMGGNSSWAYGVSESGTWGFIPINHISTKGTISQYGNMTTTLNGKKVPVVWPMYDTSIKNISSPYGPRNITASGSIHHRGYDITTGNPGEIKGEYVVASFSGTVKKIYNDTTDCGYSISISTDCIDPITGEKISIIYMHLLESPKYKNNIKISVGDYVEVGTIIGKVGKSNGNTDPDMGYHLHFEANSQNAAVGDSGRSDFTYTLNPMYFFINKNVSFSSTNSYKKYGGYWYDLNGGYQNEEIFKSYFVF